MDICACICVYVSLDRNPITTDAYRLIHCRATGSTHNTHNRNQVSLCELATLLKDKSSSTNSTTSDSSIVNSKVDTNSPINIIFLGGSVTEGYNTDYDCKGHDKDQCNGCDGKYTEGLYRYFQSIVAVPSVNQVKLVLLTGGGWTSEIQADKVIGNLRKQGLVCMSLSLYMLLIK